MNRATSAMALERQQVATSRTLHAICSAFCGNSPELMAMQRSFSEEKMEAENRLRSQSSSALTSKTQDHRDYEDVIARRTLQVEEQASFRVADARQEAEMYRAEARQETEE